MTVKKHAHDIFQEIVEIRRLLHRCPEIAFSEHETAQIIKNCLDKWGISYNSLAKTGIVALIKSGKPGKTIMLRADMDALPICEETEVSFASKNDGMMHACGHDVHMASLLSAAYILNSLKDGFCGNIKLVFQPAEENVGGAEIMVKEGVLKDPIVDAALGFHVMPELLEGNVQIAKGTIMAAVDDFDIEIKGKGGHAGWPQKCINPIYCAAKVVETLSSAPARLLPPTTPNVITVTKIEGGTIYNVVPEKVYLKGTSRSLGGETREKLLEIIEETARYTAKAFKCTAKVKFRRMYPETVNDRQMCELVALAAGEFIDKEKIITSAPSSMGAEDFSYFAREVPSCYFKVGTGSEKYNYPIHNSKFNVDEKVLLTASCIFAGAAIKYLGKE